MPAACTNTTRHFKLVLGATNLSTVDAESTDLVRLPLDGLATEAGVGPR